jgi:hypothetical protein
MNDAQRVITVVAIILCGTLVTMLLRRGLARACYSWSAYILVVGLADALILLWPRTFWNWPFWSGKELTLAVLKVGIGLELGTLAFARFPGAHRTARLLAASALTAAAFAMAMAPKTDTAGLAGLVLEANARLSHGSALLLVSLGLLVLWYRVPIHRIHRAVLRGLAAYLLLFSGTSRAALALLSEGLLEWWNVVTHLDGVAFAIMLAYWVWEAWRVTPEDDARGSAAIEARLAWRDRLGEGSGGASA